MAKGRKRIKEITRRSGATELLPFFPSAPRSHDFCEGAWRALKKFEFNFGNGKWEME